MVIFLRCHVGKNMCSIGMLLPQSLGEIGVDSAVLFLTADCKRENFWLDRSLKLFKVLPNLELF